ncbi:hypothetical protein ACOI1C_12780 [Bacillus sp. DJP31]|uniref:hypothetical protein n=1 Tax=Bacillus sp. DJP31 TaxID=3409789 RepID=UPI003BB64A30
MSNKRNQLIQKQNKMHDLAEESTNGVFAIAPKESPVERKKNHDKVTGFIKNYKTSKRIE